MSKNKQDLGPYRRKQFQTYFQFSLIAICFVIIFVLFYACTGSSKNDIDYTDAKVIQMDEPADDSPVVVFETNKGTFKAVLFPDEAPNYCKFFTGLVEKGYYDGTYVSMVQDGVYFIGGTKQADGQTTSDTDTTTIEAEYSKNLWPLKGALCAYTQEQGHLFSKKKVSNSYLLFVDNYDLTDEEQAELDSKLADSNNIPEDITDAFEKYGGVLNFSQQYTVFGQVYDGLDIYDEICGTDVADSETLERIKTAMLLQAVRIVLRFLRVRSTVQTQARRCKLIISIKANGCMPVRFLYSLKIHYLFVYFTINLY